MNAIQEALETEQELLRIHDKELELLLNKLQQEIKSLAANKSHEVIITSYAYGSEDLNGYISASSFLKNEKIVEGVQPYSSGQETIWSGADEDEPTETIFIKEKYTLKPTVLTNFLIISSRLPKYTLTFDEQRRLILNDKYLLTIPHFDSPNYYFIEYVISHPGKIIRRENLTKTAGKTEKRFHTILEQIIKDSDLRKVFFRNTSKDASEFRNKVHTKDLLGQNINEKKIANFLKKLTVIKSHN